MKSFAEEQNLDEELNETHTDVRPHPITKVRTGIWLLGHWLDELAWILEGRSSCTAVAIVENKLTIASNEFFRGTQERNQNAQLEFTCRVMEYLQIIAEKKEVLVGVRDEIMRAACALQIDSLTCRRVQIPMPILHDVVTSSVLERLFIGQAL
jgi:hypothetical protein